MDAQEVIMVIKGTTVSTKGIFDFECKGEGKWIITATLNGDESDQGFAPLGHFLFALKNGENLLGHYVSTGFLTITNNGFSIDRQLYVENDTPLVTSRKKVLKRSAAVDDLASLYVFFREKYPLEIGEVREADKQLLRSQAR